ncbi:TKL protein kinase, partial [Phytophthora megakarya]
MLDNRVVSAEEVRWVEIFALIGYAILCFMSLLLVVYLRVNRREAFKGNPDASRKVILPAFEPLLWILAAAAGIYVIFFSVALKTKLYATGFPNLAREFFYCGRMFVFTLVLVFLCQKSVSLPALRSAVMKTLVLSSYTLPIIWFFAKFAPDQLALLFFVRLTTRPLLLIFVIYAERILKYYEHTVGLSWSITCFWYPTLSSQLLIFVIYVCFIRPPAGRANPKVLRAHGWFIVVYHVFLVPYTIISKYAPGSFVYPILSYFILFWSSMCPLLIWRILAADTDYWRGMGKRVCSLQQVAPLGSHTRSTSTINENISSHGLHVLIETHREFLIDFAHLEIKRKIGSGGVHGAMFSGLLRSTKTVAVKVYTPQHFTEEVVGELSHEAALCASLSHPNIVSFYGMCVCPPTVCLVTELCQYTLDDVLVTRGKHRESQRAFWCGKNRDDNDLNLDLQRMQLNVAYMLDCSRAVAYIHSFSPPFLHRNIKPANFLVDVDNTLKLTDFSDSRRLPNEIPASNLGINNQPIQPKMTVTGTVNYMAPEMIGSSTGLAAYAEAADVYSLAITFWDILFPDREKYPDAGNNHNIVFESVLRGSRPPIDADMMDE